MRQYDDQQIHTVHLVFTSKTKYSPPKTQLPVRTKETETNGLRHRNVTGTPQTINTPEPAQQITSNPNLLQNIPAGVSSTSSSPYTFNGNSQQPNEYTMAHQIAMQNWMQQAYSQYLNQYMNL